MAGHFFVPGPAQIAVGQSGSALSYLGYSVNGVRFNEQVMSKDVMADFAGPMMPADQMFAGKIMVATMELTWFDPTVFNTYVMPRFPGGVAGAIQSNEIGKLIWAEGTSLRLTVRAARQTALSAGIYAANMAGMNVPKCWVHQSVSLPFSTDVQKIPLSFYALTTIDPTNLNGTLWDTSMSGFPTVA